jgi:hypothetical protein
MPACGGRRIAAAFAATLLYGILPQVACAQDRTCTLAGTVFNSATNAGIPHALVTYFGGGSGFRFTDSGGNFNVENVSCGGFSLNVSKPGYISGQEDNSGGALLANPAVRDLIQMADEQAGNPPKPAMVNLDVTPDSPAARIPLIPLASISGSVLDENGEPLGGVVVQGIAVKTSLQGTDYAPAKTTHTDDQGRYELLDLPPADYLVRLAGESSSTQYFQGNTPAPNNDHRGMQPVYYPNADSPAAAQVFDLAPGANSSADFRQATQAAFDINGRIAGFVPQAWTQLQLYRDGDRVPLGRAFVNILTGQFRLTDIPHGGYTLRLTQYQADPPQWLAAEVPLTMTAAPIENLVVPMSGAVDIPVTVSYEEGAKNDGQITLWLHPQHSPENLRQLIIGNRSGLAQQSAPDARSNDIKDVIPDKYKLSVDAPGENGYVASAKLGGVDVLRGEFAITGAAGELHLTVRGDGATLKGKVTFEGQPAMGAQVFLIPASGGEGVKLGFSDQDGNYTIPNVPPGDYRVHAWTSPPSAKEVLGVTGDTLSLQPNDQQILSLEATAPEHK